MTWKDENKVFSGESITTSGMSNEIPYIPDMG